MRLGYSSLGLEQVLQYDDAPSDSAPANTFNMKESFESGRENDEAMPNIWLPPDVLPGFQEACLSFFWVRSKKSRFVGLSLS